MSPTCDQKVTEPKTEGVTFHCFPSFHPPEICLEPEHQKIKNSFLQLCLNGRNEGFSLRNPSDWIPSLFQGSPNIPVPNLPRDPPHPPVPWESQHRNEINSSIHREISGAESQFLPVLLGKFKIFQTGQKFPHLCVQF